MDKSAIDKNISDYLNGAAEGVDGVTAKFE